MLKTAHPMQWVIVALVGVFLLVQFIGAAVGDPDKGFHLREFGTVPVAEAGRIKPLMTFGRARLMLINNTSIFRDEKGNVHPATEWLLDTMLAGPFGSPTGGQDHKIFRIENLELLGLLHLEERPGKWRYSYNEIAAHEKDLHQAAIQAENTEQRKRSLFQQKVLQLAQHVDLFVRIAMLDSPGVVPARGDADWLSIRKAMQLGGGLANPEPEAAFMIGLLQSYAKDDPQAFNKELKSYLAECEKRMPAGVMDTLRTEVYFNEVEPFYNCAILYGVVFLLAVMSWIAWFPTLSRAAWWSMLVIVLVHAWALVIRMYIQDRPLVFVTNLYSSAIFIGFGCVLTCLVSEFFFRNSIATAVGAATGGLSLIIAHMLSLEAGDTMEMMQAVLDTNFWLATHVTCITFGYTAMFVSGFMGIAYIAAMTSTAVLDMMANGLENVRRFIEGPESRAGARGFFTHFFDTNASSIMGKMIYGVVCFGMFLSFTGTVLGGLWADYSWGRFWGWDPKENGALLIVIWCALILHARWGGMVKQRGIAVLAVLGNIVTAWSWFGTNFLGVGLHSYGFMAGAMFWLLAWDGLMLTIAGIGLLPLQKWAAARPRPQLAAASAKPEPARVPQTV